MATTGTNPSDPQSGAGTTQTQSATETARQESERLADRAREKAGEIKDRAEGTVRERARSAVDHQKEAAIGRIEGVAHALRSASDDLRERGQPMVADYSRHLADGLESMADSLSRRNLDDLVGGVEDFARQRPVAFLSGAMVAGFALARFMKSSSARRSRPSGAEYGEASAGGAGTRGTEYGGASAGSAGTRSTGSTAWPGGASTPPPVPTGTPGAAGYDRPREGGF